MRDVTMTELERLEEAARGVDVALPMEEEAFRAFYDRTARTLWAYLARITGDRQAADDLLQETFYRFLRAGAEHESEAHRRASLFHTATNLVRDRRRRQAIRPPCLAGDRLEREPGVHQPPDRRTDLSRAMDALGTRDRALIWLAYAHGSSHQEIADAMGLKAASVKQLLFRARRRLAERLGRARRG